LVDGATVSGYGPECATSKATISGADDFSGGWVKSGNIWSRSVALGTPKITRLFVNDAPHATARWPNAASGSQGYALVSASAAASTTRIQATTADLAKLKTADLKNATLYVRTSAWMIEQRQVSSFDTTTGIAMLDKATLFAIDPTEGYVLEDKQWMLDAPGEFFHDTVNGKLYVYAQDSAAQANLNAARIEGSVRDTALALSQRNGLGVSSIAVRMGRSYGLDMTDVPGAVVDNIDASHNGNTGVRLIQDPTKAGSTVSRSTLSNNGVYGIDAQFAGRAVISNNTVTGTGTTAFPGWTHAAIAGGDGSKIISNIVSGSAYHGIRFSGTNASQVIGNTISSYCLRLADCGAIYTWNGPKATGSSQTSLVENNQILGASANADGGTGFGLNVVVGVFLDDFSSGVTVRGNMVYNVPVGISVHNGRNNTIDTNRIWLPTMTAISAGMDQSDMDYLTGNVFKNNQIVPVKTAADAFPAMPVFSESYPIWFFNNLSGSASITSGSNVFTGNQVVRMDGSVDGVHTWIRSNTEDRKLSSVAWAKFNPLDAATATPMKFSLYSLVLGPELVPGGNFDNGLGLWTSYFSGKPNTGSVRNSSGAAGCSGNCVTFTSGIAGDYINSPPFTMKANVPHLYAYTAALGGAATLGWPYLSRAVTPWDSMALSGFTSSVGLSGAAGQVMRYEGFFTPKSAEPTRVNLQLQTAGVPVSFDSVSVREISGFSFAKSSDWGVVAYAPISGPTTVTCASLGWGSTCSVAGIDGKSIALPQTLPAGSSQLYLRADSAWRQ
jgi:parallel beta-helix repeat protein